MVNQNNDQNKTTAQDYFIKNCNIINKDYQQLSV